MCGRFAFDLSIDMLIELFGLTAQFPVTASFNVAPTQLVAVVRPAPAGGNRLDLLQWGLIPSWAKDRAIGSRMINARCETAGEKPAFRRLLNARRCVVPASGFFEWRSEGKRKMPLYITLRSRAPLLLAGLWDCWRSPEGELVDSCTIVTTAANSLLNPVHDRMPVILDPEHARSWLDPQRAEAGFLLDLCRPYPAELMQMYPVSPLVNSVRNNGADLVRPLDETVPATLF
ncbi:MAG TPA: SOS response-associated peptidase [Geomonas sp.]|nr:SOS response-associated peptidase [Geomonas sp.]